MRLRRQWIWFSHLKHQKLVVSSYFRLIANLHSCQNWPRNYLWGNATILLFLFYMIKESSKLPGSLFIQQHLGFKSISGTFSCRRCQTQTWNAYWPSLKIKSSQFCIKSSSCFLYGCHGNGRYTKWVDDYFPLQFPVKLVLTDVSRGTYILLISMLNKYFQRIKASSIFF